MAKTFEIKDFDPKTDPMLDCSSAESAQEGFANDAPTLTDMPPVPSEESS